MKVSSLFFFVGIFVLTACSPTAMEPEQQSVSALLESQNRIEFVEFGYPIQAVMPADLADKGTAVVDFNSSSGELTVNVDGGYTFHIMEDPTPLAQLRDDLRNDEVFSYTFYEEGDDGFLYESALPTGETYSFHVMRSFDIDGRKFIAVTDDNLVYSKYEARLVSETINSLSKVQ